MTDAQLFNKLDCYCSHTSLPIVSIISHLSPLDTPPHYLFNIQFHILLPFTARSSLHIFRSIFSLHSSYLPRTLRSPNPFPSLNSRMCVCVHKSIRIAAQTMINMSHAVTSTAHYIKLFKTLQIHRMQSVSVSIPSIAQVLTADV